MTFAALVGTVNARTAPVRVLVGTSVSDAVRDSMSPALWRKLVATYVNAETVPFDGAPTLDDCRKAKAAYMVDAPFELRPRLPGMMNSEGRVAGRTHLVVTNCVTAQVAYDQVILLDSEPPSTENTGDFEAVPETSWERAVPQELARYPIFFARVARIKSVQPPFAYIDLQGSAPLKVNDMLLAFASSNGERRPPILLTVSATDLKFVQVIFSTTNGETPPQAGDYVEPVRATPSPSPSPRPTRR